MQVLYIVIFVHWLCVKELELFLLLFFFCFFLSPSMFVLPFFCLYSIPTSGSLSSALATREIRHYTSLRLRESAFSARVDAYGAHRGVLLSVRRVKVKVMYIVFIALHHQTPSLLNRSTHGTHLNLQLFQRFVFLSYLFSRRIAPPAKRVPGRDPPAKRDVASSRATVV